MATTLHAHRTTATVGPDGKVTLNELSLKPDDEVVEVIVLTRSAAAASEERDRERYPLRGLPYRFDDPFSPAIDPDEWEANR